MRRGAPAGFFLCGAVAAGITVTLLAGLLLVATDPYLGPWPPAARGACLLLLAVGAVTVEALWRVRPWAFAATALMVACYAAVGVAAVATGKPVAVSRSLPVLVLCMAAELPILRYLRVRSRQLWPRAGVRVPAPRP